jgi:hypothetical protein
MTVVVGKSVVMMYVRIDVLETGEYTSNSCKMHCDVGVGIKTGILNGASVTGSSRISAACQSADSLRDFSFSFCAISSFVALWSSMSTWQNQRIQEHWPQTNISLQQSHDQGFSRYPQIPPQLAHVSQGKTWHINS